MTKELYLVADMDRGRQRDELSRLGIGVLSERDVLFIDGTSEPQWEIRDEAGKKWLLVPNSAAACKRQLEYGRYLPPYTWIGPV